MLPGSRGRCKGEGRGLTSACSEYKRTLEAPISAARLKMSEKYVELTPLIIVVEFVEVELVPVPEMVEFVIESVEFVKPDVVEFVPSRVEFIATVPFASSGSWRVAWVEGLESQETKAMKGTGVEVWFTARVSLKYTTTPCGHPKQCQRES